jgi:predicted TIM-barrel fold metal-dependent hydrolase
MVATHQGGVDALGLDDETRDLYLGGNARRVFGL